MRYNLVFRKNGFVGLYDLLEKNQIFNVPEEMIAKRLKLEFKNGEFNDIKIIIENENENINVLKLPTIKEYFNL